MPCLYFVKPVFKDKNNLFLKKKYLPVILPSLKASFRLCYCGSAQFPGRKLAEFQVCSNFFDSY